MISCSHWGMFESSRAMFMLPGYKMAAIGSIADFSKPGSIVEMVPLKRGEAQPIYRSHQKVDQ